MAQDDLLLGDLDSSVKKYFTDMVEADVSSAQHVIDATQPFRIRVYEGAGGGLFGVKLPAAPATGGTVKLGDTFEVLLDITQAGPIDIVDNADNVLVSPVKDDRVFLTCVELGGTGDTGTWQTTRAPKVAGGGGTVLVDGVTVEGDGSGTPLFAQGRKIGTMDLDDIDETEEKIGPELVTNGDFSDGSTGWTEGADGTVTVVSNGRGGQALRITANAGTGTKFPQIIQSSAPDGKVLAVETARSDGANAPRFKVGSSATVIGTTDTDWTDITINENITAGSVVVSFRIVDPVGTEYIEVDLVTVKEQRTVGNTNKLPLARYFENRILHSEDFTNAAWTLVRALTPETSTGIYDDDGTEYQGYKSDNTAANTHGIRQNFTVVEAGVKTIAKNVKAGDLDWYAIQDVGGGSGLVYYDLTTGKVGTESGGARGAMEDLGDGRWRLFFEYFLDTGTALINFLLAESDLDSVFDGNNGATIHAYATKAQLYDGKIEDDIQYITTTNVANPGEQRGNWVSDREIVNRVQYEWFYFLLTENVNNTSLYFYSERSPGIDGDNSKRSGATGGLQNANACSPETIKFDGTIVEASIKIKGAGVQNGTVTYPVTLKTELYETDFNSDTTKIGDLYFDIPDAYTVGTFSVGDTNAKGIEINDLQIPVKRNCSYGLKFVNGTGASEVGQTLNIFVWLKVEKI